MFKINESIYDEVCEQLEINLKKTASNLVTENDKKTIEALELLNSSAELLEQFGLEKEANILTKLIVVAAKKKKNKKDKATNGLTSEKMLSNLANKGTVFNADDQNMAHDHKLESFPEAMHGEPVIYLEKGDDDYNTYCHKCAEKMQNEEGKHMLGHVYTEGPNRECEKCGEQLESAMGQDAYYEENADPEDNIKSHEHPEEYKHEQLEKGMDEYDAIMDELDENHAEDQVFI